MPIGLRHRDILGWLVANMYQTIYGPHAYSTVTARNEHWMCNNAVQQTHRFAISINKFQNNARGNPWWCALIVYVKCRPWKQFAQYLQSINSCPTMNSLCHMTCTVCFCFEFYHKFLILSITSPGRSDLSIRTIRCNGTDLHQPTQRRNSIAGWIHAPALMFLIKERKHLHFLFTIPYQLAIVIRVQRPPTHLIHSESM